MKLIIAGGRNLSMSCDGILAMIYTTIGAIPCPLEVVCGGAEGIDESGKRFVELMEEDTIILKPFPAAWTDLSHPDAVIRTRKDGTKYDAIAGHRRNRQMAEYADALLLIWDGESGGSASMKKEMLKLKKPIYEVTFKCHNLK